MDLTSTVVPDSTQINADDLIAGPVDVTIVDVRAGSSDQPVNIITREFGEERAYRPGKSMRRVLIAAWGKDSNAYIGKRLRLYRDPSITFGRDTVGGVRISHMSGIKDRLAVALTVTKGRRAPFVVEPLPDARDWQTEIDACTDLDALKELWKAAQAEGVNLDSPVRVRKKQLVAATVPEAEGGEPA